MSHVDEATLHAFLDGELRTDEPERARQVEAHIQDCDACRTRLETAAALRDDAAGILDALDAAAAAPGPDFQEVRVRAGQAGSASSAAGDEREAELRRSYGWVKRVGWAAALVVALGTGYMARDLVLGPGVDESDAVSDFMVRDRDARSRADETPPATAPESDRPSAPVESAPSAEAGARGDVAEMEQAETFEPARLAEEPATREATAEAGGGAAAVAVDDWVEASLDEAEARVGSLYLLPGAELTGVEVAGDPSMAAARTVQRLPLGDVHVIQRPAQGGAVPGETEPTAAKPSPERTRDRRAPAPDLMESRLRPDAGAGPGDPSTPWMQTVTVTVDGATLTITGPLPPEGLRLLADSAAPRVP